MTTFRVVYSVESTLSTWTHEVVDEHGAGYYVGTYDECVEWAALTGAERDHDYWVEPRESGE